MSVQPANAERVLSTLYQAIEAFRATPGRRGRMVRLQGATDVLAAGDLHGNVENFRHLMQQADLAAHPDRHLVVQELVHGSGRYPDGGDQSHQLLDQLAAAKCQFPRQVHMLLGNHELAQWTEQPIAKDEDGDLVSLFRKGVEEAYGIYATEAYAAYLHLFAVIPLAIRTPNRVFLSHSLPGRAHLATFNPVILERNYHREGDLKAGGPIYSLVWDRDVSAANVTAFLRLTDADLLITGHIPCEKGFAAPNDRQLILDSLEAPAGYCLFPADRPLTHADLVKCVSTF